MSKVGRLLTKVLVILALAGSVAHCINEGLLTSNPFMETAPHGSGNNVGSIRTQALLAAAPSELGRIGGGTRLMDELGDPTPTPTPTESPNGPGNGGGGIGGGTRLMDESGDPTPTPTPTESPNGPGNGGGGIGGGT